MAQETKAEKEAREAAEQAALVESTPGAGDGGGRVKVSVDDGPISFTRGGVEVASVNVKDGHVTAKDGHELQVVLDNVAGAELVKD